MGDLVTTLRINIMTRGNWRVAKSKLTSNWRCDKAEAPRTGIAPIARSASDRSTPEYKQDSLDKMLVSIAGGRRTEMLSLQGRLNAYVQVKAI